MESKPRYDVFIVTPDEHRIVRVVGTDMFLSDGFYSAIQRRNTFQCRVGTEHLVKIARAGKFIKGDILVESAHIE